MLLKASVTKDGRDIIVSEDGQVIATVYRNYALGVTAERIVEHFNTQEELLYKQYKESQDHTIRPFVIEDESQENESQGGDSATKIIEMLYETLINVIPYGEYVKRILFTDLSLLKNIVKKDGDPFGWIAALISARGYLDAHAK